MAQGLKRPTSLRNQVVRGNLLHPVMPSRRACSKIFLRDSGQGPFPICGNDDSKLAANGI
jgi:hypothetical protein